MSSGQQELQVRTSLATDGGSHWKSGVVPGAEKLQFRDVQGVSDREAYLMSIGDNTGDFRIYKTEDGGAHWRIKFQNKTVNAFYDWFRLLDAGSRCRARRFGQRSISRHSHHQWRDLAFDRQKYAACSVRGSFVFLQRHLHQRHKDGKTCLGATGRNLKRCTDPGDSRWRRHMGCVRYSARKQPQRGRFLGGVPRSLAWHCGWRRLDLEQLSPSRNVGQWRPNMEANQEAAHSGCDLLVSLMRVDSKITIIGTIKTPSAMNTIGPS